MTHGINIQLTQLDGVAIAEDGRTAVIGGGIRSRNLTDVLWAAGKQTGARCFQAASVTHTQDHTGF